MPGKHVSIPDAARAVAMVEAGIPVKHVAETLHLNKHTIKDILNGCSSWGQIAETPIFKAFRLDQKKHLEAASRAIAQKCLIQVDEQLPKTSAYQAAGIYGLLRQHERLDAGEPTEIHAAAVNIHTVASLDRLAAMLGHALVEQEQVERSPKVIVIEVEGVEVKSP